MLKLPSHLNRINRRIIASVLIVAGLIMGAQAIHLLAAGRPRPPHLANTPSATKPTAAEVASYQVPADNPKYIAIPALGIKQARVLGLGLTNTKQIAVPNNLHDTGWYAGSSKPGQRGAMFIYGHVSSWQANGVFVDLKKLRQGDKIAVTRGDDASFTYQVVSAKTYPSGSVDMREVLSAVDARQPGLNVMTCAGKFDVNTGEFSQRLVVFTKLVN